MPKAAKKSTRPVRCTYVEKGVRCQRNGSGSPALCRPHLIVAGEAARTGARFQVGAVFERGRDLAHELLDDVFAGRPIKEKVASAVSDFAWEMGANYTDYHPPIEDVPIDPFGNGQTQQPPRQRRHPRWEPEPDPVAYEEQAKLERAKRARVVLGFSPSEPISADSLKRRHRELVLKHHPDRGGSVARMAEINSAVDALAAVL